MPFDVHFTPPGDIDSTWGTFPARSECCKLDGTIWRGRTLHLGQFGAVNYDPADPPPDIVAMLALYEATDPVTLDDGAWTVAYNYSTSAAEIQVWGGFTDVEAQHTESEPSPGAPEITYIRVKAAYLIGWSSIYAPFQPWRAIDGDTIRLEWKIRTIIGGVTTDSDESSDLDMAGGETEVWEEEWRALEEPADGLQYLVAGKAYAPRECLGD